MSPDHRTPNPAPFPQNTALAPMDQAIDRALAHPPAIAISSDFAARVARQAALRPLPPSSHRLGWGPRLALASGALLTVAMFALAPHATPTLSSARFDAELMILAELSGLLLFWQRLLHLD